MQFSFGYLILGLVIIYLVYQLQQAKANQPPKVNYQGVQDEPWMKLPWNQTTRYGRNSNQLEVTIAPHSWDIKNDPDYYRWLAYHQYGQYLEDA